jgi:hypothetical protein
VEVELDTFLILALDWGRWSGYWGGESFPYQELNPGNPDHSHYITGWTVPAHWHKIVWNILKLNFSVCTHFNIAVIFSVTSECNDWVIKIWSQAEAKGFFLFPVCSDPEAHPASCPMGTGVLSSDVKSCQGVTLTAHPHLVPRSRMSRSYTLSPPCPSMVCSGTALLLPPNAKLYLSLGIYNLLLNV